MSQQTTHERFIQAHGLAIREHVPAQPSGLRIIATHGWLDNALSFDRLAKAMPQHHWAALDFPGHGYSGHLPEGHWYQFGNYVHSIEQARATLGWDQFVLMGHSMGAAIGTLYAVAEPERLQAFIAIEALGPLSESPNGAVTRFRQALRQRTQFRPKKRTLKHLDAVIDARAEAGALPRDVAAELMVRNTAKTDDGWLFRSDARLRLDSLTYLSEAQVIEFIEAVTTPTLVIQSSTPWSLFDNPKHAARITHLPNHEHILLPGGHHLHMTETEAMAEQINAFLQAQSSC